jgi:hypothetical protein
MSRRRNRKKPEPKPEIRTWLTHPDEDILPTGKHADHKVWSVAPSLRVGPPVMDAVLDGSPEAEAIVDSYQLRQSRATRVVTA